MIYLRTRNMYVSTKISVAYSLLVIIVLQVMYMYEALQEVLGNGGIRAFISGGGKSKIEGQGNKGNFEEEGT